MYEHTWTSPLGTPTSVQCHCASIAKHGSSTSGISRERENVSLEVHVTFNYLGINMDFSTVGVLAGVKHQAYSA